MRKIDWDYLKKFADGVAGFGKTSITRDEMREIIEERDGIFREAQSRLRKIREQEATIAELRKELEKLRKERGVYTVKGGES